jgi:glycosyltransferase involved in cell wall biosynthesis
MKSTSSKSPIATMIGCTIAHTAAMPHAIVLATSFLEFHPEARFAILLLDGPSDSTALPKTIMLGLRDLGLAAGEEWRLPMLYGGPQLASVLKPALFQALLKTGAGTVAYFEPSTLIFESLSNLELAQGESAIVATEPIQNDFGDYGRSFIAARSGAEPTLHSWFDRLRNDNTARGCDQRNDSHALKRLFDDVPHRVITPPGFAAAYWNLDPKSFTYSSNGYQVGGQPLRSFDFRGYDPDKPHVLSKYQGLEPRILLSDYPAISQICDEYREKVIRAAHHKDNSRRYKGGVLPSGLRIDRRMLCLYRDALDQSQLGKMPEPPSPFGPEGEEGFLKWLNEPVGQMEKGVTRYMLAVLDEREDVKNAFPNPLEADAAGFRDWYLLYGRHELDLPAALVPHDAPLSGAAAATPAVNVAGYFRAELGIGVAARSLLSALEAAGIPFNTISFDATANRQSHPFADRAAGVGAADLNIVCVNPDQLSLFAEQTGPELRQGRYTIGVWFWEVEDFPRSFHGAFNYVDEIWVASDFMRETFLKVSPKPVFKFRLPVLTPQVDPSLSRRDLGLPDKFVFLFSFDLLSVLERKNPVGLIKAFTAAFPKADGPALIIKTINGDKRCLEMEKLRYAVRDRSDITLMDGYLSPIENRTLTALSDCYVSLHRSEGFGLTIAEAMGLGKPAIATAYSGNLEFMTSENSYLCPTRRSEVGPEREPYPADSHWSEPDLEAAAGLLRHVYDHQAEAQARGLRAAEDIRVLHTPEVSGLVIRQRLVKIRRRRSAFRSLRSVAFLEDRLEELEAEKSEWQRRRTS